MHTQDLTQIRILSHEENVDHPVLGTLVEQILHLLNSNLAFSDILIHQCSPLMLRQPKGLVAVNDTPITEEEMKEFFGTIEPEWESRIANRAFDRSIDLYTARIRANCFSFHGKKRLGCVIRRFPTEPHPLASLGLQAPEQEFAKLTSGLLLFIGDTCQGKSTTIASILDQINKTRSGHIITIEDPVETIIPHRKCIVTQREVGPDGDVSSYYLGALDALRERPDVIVIGEIRDAETAQEALALAESGPLVLASLHARSTELGLQKMLRLLGSTEAQNQALANALRGVLCQALLPAIDGERYHVATECLTPNADVVKLIESGRVGELRGQLEGANGKGAAGCHSMNTTLLTLLKEKKIRFEDAKNVTTDRLGFTSACKKALGI